jgi:uncharacterized protein YecT (DUF1311 family)
MRLLEIIKLAAATLPLALIAPYGYAESHCDMNDISNSGIIFCSQESFDKIDRILNEQYILLIRETPALLAAELKRTQREWVAFKESYCTDVYESVFPGQEAPIEKLSCLRQITSFRVSELLYLRTGVISDGYPKAASVVRNANLFRNRQEAIKFMEGGSDPGEHWSSYARKNCAIAQRMHSEDIEKCMVRMKFQTPTN